MSTPAVIARRGARAIVVTKPAAPIASVGDAEWGGITGTLSAQTDLQSALDLKAPLASPTLTGTPAAPTAAGGTNTTQIATTAFVGSAVSTHAGATDPHGDRAYADGLAVNYATAAQGALADSATQPGDLATVATTGAYSDLSGLPTLGTAAAAATTDFATADQGALADTALQAADIATKLDDLSAGTADAIVTASADGTLLSRAAYTIASLLTAARDRATHTGTQLAATISDFAAAALAAVTWSTLTGKPTFGNSSGLDVGTTAGTVAAGDDSRLSDDRTASGLRSATTVVAVAAAAAPSTGQVLTATGASAATWQTPSGGSPAGAGTELQYRNAGAFGAVAGTSWAANQLLITAQDAAVTPLAVRAAASQVANRQDWQTSAGTADAYVSASGSIHAPELRVPRNGYVRCGDAGAAVDTFPYIRFADYAGGAAGDSLHCGANHLILLDAPNVRITSTSGFGFDDGSTIYLGDLDTQFRRLAAGVMSIRGISDSAGAALNIRELSADPADPPEGTYTQWMSDGTGSGDDGDIMVKITAGGVTKTATLIDFSAI